jgi:hypothetical protein
MPHSQPVSPDPVVDAGPPTGTLDRRGFLRGTAGGMVAVGIASLLPSGCAADYPQAGLDGVKLLAMTEKEYAVTRAAAEALLADVPVNPSAVATAIDAELAAVGEPIRGDFKSMLGLVEHLTFLGGRRHRFTALPPAQRIADLRNWSRSRFKLRRGAFRALQGFIVYFAYVRDETRAITGFPGPWPERVKIAARPIDFGEIA